MSILLEKRRDELVAKSKKEVKGLQRYKRRFKSKVARSNKDYNNIDMNKFFKEDIINIVIKVQGETDDYQVKISFGGILEEIQRELRNTDKLDLRIITKALVTAFNRSDTYIRCSCKDFYYRFGFYATVNKYIEGEPQLIPSKETNPDDTLGSGCKHSLLVLSNTSWMIKVASVINNYINYMKQHRENLYANVIYPAVYGKRYEELIQQTMLDDETLETDTQDIDTSNIYARTKTQFKPGNIHRIQKGPDKDQISIDELEDEEN